MNQYDYIDAGFRVFGLYGLNENGQCECGNSKCKAAFKHPRTTNWQHTPNWSNEQLKTMEKMGQFKTGFGVLVDQSIIIDIDPRNGGDKSYKKLCSDTGVDYKAESGLVVKTGGGGWHIYFKKPEGLSVISHLSSYPGIDFKSSGFVVGAGSLHATGAEYECEKGDPTKVGSPPEALIDLLIKKDSHRAICNGIPVDVTEKEIQDMLSFFHNEDLDYEEWIRCGMAIHHATSGNGFALWDEWSKQSKKYDTSCMEYKWHSFGKSANPVTLGTLVYYAEKGGYVAPVTFTPDAPEEEDDKSIDTSSVDLLRPPGFVGKICEWVNSRSEYPTETLAVAAALSIVATAAGLKYTDENKRKSVTNLFCFCVAGSGVGKQAMIDSVRHAMIAIGYGKATHGGIKSQQGVVRNLISNQVALYLIDEIGYELNKMVNASKNGGADYLQGAIGVLMSAYSAASSVLGVEEDIRTATIDKLKSEIASWQKAVDENNDPTGRLSGKIESNKTQMELLEKTGGIYQPFVSITGYTTPENFNELVNGEQTKKGFFTRALIFNEKETNPKWKIGFNGEKPLPDDLKMVLLSLSASGDSACDRIENYENRIEIPIADDAKRLMDTCRESFYQKAEAAKDNGLESIYRRCYELTTKLSLILGVSEGLITVEHVTWAYALVCNDAKEKLNLAAANMAEAIDKKDEAVCRKIVAQLDKINGAGLTTGVIVNRVRSRKYNEELIKQCLAVLEKNRLIKSIEVESPRKTTKRWFLI